MTSALEKIRSQLEAGRKLELEATPGPWLFYPYKGESGLGIIANNPLPIMVARSVIREEDNDFCRDSRTRIAKYRECIELMAEALQVYGDRKKWATFILEGDALFRGTVDGDECVAFDSDGDDGSEHARAALERASLTLCGEG